MPSPSRRTSPPPRASLCWPAKRRRRKRSAFPGPRTARAMPEFAYIAVDPKGKEKRGTLKAPSDADARAGLEARKLYVVKVKPQPVAPAAEVVIGGLKLTRGKRLSAKQLTLFTRQLATLSQVSP